MLLVEEKPKWKQKKQLSFCIFIILSLLDIMLLKVKKQKKTPVSRQTLQSGAWGLVAEIWASRLRYGPGGEGGVGSGEEEEEEGEVF